MHGFPARMSLLYGIVVSVILCAIYYYYYFASAAVSVDSSHMTVLCGVDSVHLRILLMGTCRQCGSWSVAGHKHRKVIGRDPICAS